MKKLISIVIPAYNEAENCATIANEIKSIFANINYQYTITFIDDGSTDSTAQVLERLSSSDKSIKYISFSRNFGHQAALKAGLENSFGDCTISMDCDMQHPPELLSKLIEKWEEGYDIVYTCRREDHKLPLFKRLSSKLFYRVLNSLSNVKIEAGTADFRLMDRKAVEAINSLTESEPFIRGLVKWIGFSQYAISYSPGQRIAGESKYTLSKMINLALEGVTSFSVKPLYIAIWIGFIMALIGILGIPYVIYSFVAGHALAGWSSTMIAIIFFGGLQLLMTGIIGVYLGKVFVGSKQRPAYIIKKSNIQ